LILVHHAQNLLAITL